MVEEGLVVDQSPSGGNAAEAGTTVTILVSLGKNPEVEVPDVVGKSEADAAKALNDAGFETVPSSSFSDTVSVGNVISQDPEAGSMEPVGSPVGISVSQGPRPAETATVPDVVGKTQGEATDLLEQAGYQVTSTRAFSDAVARDVVAAQAPMAGTVTQPGIMVALLVSDGPKPDTEFVAVPDVRGMSLDEATATLEKAGLKVTSFEFFTQLAPEGAVFAQLPPWYPVYQDRAVLVIVSKGRIGQGQSLQGRESRTSACPQRWTSPRASPPFCTIGAEEVGQPPTAVFSGFAMRTCFRVLAILAIACVAFLVVTSTAAAHVPQFAEGGASLGSATVIEDPATSWVYYGTITPGEARYYEFDLAAGDRLYVQLLTPREGPFPAVAAMGPGVSGEGRLPTLVQAPVGMPVVMAQGAADEAEYEPFTPGAYWYPGTIDTRVTQAGTYHVAVFSEVYAGPYGIAVGYEEKFTVVSWIRLPADLLTIYAWDGSWLSALWPGIAVLAAGGALVAWRVRTRRRKRSPPSWLGLAAGVLCLTTSATVLYQMLRAAGRSGFDPAMGITAFFIIGPAVVGGLLLWLGWRTARAPSLGTRIGMLILGLAGVGLLAGYFIGPVLAILAALAPPYRATEKAATAGAEDGRSAARGRWSRRAGSQQTKRWPS
jgi:beta-lactam-binding protein with PASTA domain